MALTSKQIDDLTTLLAGTLSDYDLERLVGLSTGDELYVHWVGRGMPLGRTIRELLRALEQEGATSQFLAEVYRERPKRGDVRLQIALLYPEIIGLAAQSPPLFDLQESGAPGPAVADGAFAPGLQRNIKPHLQQLNIGTWAIDLMRTQRQVCRIEIEDGAAGSGFLIGPEAVLTNWHVVEKAVARGVVAKIACRFDYAERPDGGRDEGVRVPLHADGVVYHRPYAPAELTQVPDNPAPTATELDFALLRLARPIGAEALGGQPRGWVALPSTAADPAEGAPLIIVQHPDGGPMKLAIDTQAVLPLPPPPDRPRLRYSTNTESGSSGSPVFNMDWTLVALHHFGDPAWGTPQFNQGVPAHLIRADLVAAGHAAFLG